MSTAKPDNTHPEDDFTIKTLGNATIDSPFWVSPSTVVSEAQFVKDSDRILLDDKVSAEAPATEDRASSLALAGPRKKIFFDPQDTTAAVVTCGGLCPGINDVIRGLVMVSHYRYGVREFLGFRYGYWGFHDKYADEIIQLTPDMVADIHEQGGTVLGSSRGTPGTEAIVDRLVEREVNILYVIGGDGTMRGASAIVEEIERRGLSISVIGVPKTIDNDIQFIDQSFGFNTAFSQAVEAIQCAHMEAHGAPHCVGLVKVMGRDSGFIAAHATLAASHVNFTLIPEVPFQLDGPRGLLASLHERLQRRRHAVIVVAEGAGQDLLEHEQAERDASGNEKLKDIGPYLASKIKDYFAETKCELNLKYIDPSYMLRSVPATPSDSVYCWRLAQNAVHAAMCGKTEMVIGEYHGRIVHVPMHQTITGRKQVNPEGELWLSVLESTGQP